MVDEDFVDMLEEEAGDMFEAEANLRVKYAMILSKYLYIYIKKDCRKP